MECLHAVEHLVGTKDGIKCRNCGKTFATFAELEADRPKPKKEQAEEVTEKPTEEKTEAEKQEEEIDETLKAAKEKKKTTKKGGK